MLSCSPRAVGASRGVSQVNVPAGDTSSRTCSARVTSVGTGIANTGGNTVIGPPDATVVNGPAAAVGNVSRR